MENSVQSQRSRWAGLRKQSWELAKTRTLLAVSSTGLLGQGYDCETPFHEGSQTASFQISPEIPLPR